MYVVATEKQQALLKAIAFEDGVCRKYRSGFVLVGRLVHRFRVNCVMSSGTNHVKGYYGRSHRLANAYRSAVP